MKTSEFMVHDLVMIGGKVAQMESIVPDSKQFVDGSLYSYVYNDGEYEPIPLSDKRLKLNGWVRRPYSQTYEKEGVPFALEIGKVGLYAGECIDDDTIIFSFEYVHQVQHALRLCGLNDLADNFKV